MLYVFRRGMEVCCHVCAKDERDMRRVNIRTRKSFPFGETNNKQNIIIVVVAFYSKKKPNERERERETPAKNDDQNASSLLLSERGMDVPCETLSKTRVLLCAHSTAEVVGFFSLFYF